MDAQGRVRIGFVGAGGFATGVMAPAVHRSSEVVLQAAAARDPLRAEALGPVGRTHATYAALLDDPDVDLVYVVLSHDLHRPVVEAALLAGKHVLCEKPLGLDPAEVASMQAAAAAADRLLVEAFWYRWHPRQQALEALVRDGALGEVRAIDSGFTFAGDLTGNFRLDPARAGGAAYDVGCYPASFAVAALGDAAPVAAELIDVDLRGGVDVRSEAVLRFDGGVQAHAVGGFTGPDQRWGEVVGTAGRAVLSEPCFSDDTETGPTSMRVERLSAGGEAVASEEIAFAAADPRRAMVEGVAAVVRGDADEAGLPVQPAHTRAVAEATALVRAAIAAR